MQLLNGNVIISSQDLVATYECSHRLKLNYAAKLDLIAKPVRNDPALEIITRMGIEHEQRVLSELKQTFSVVELEQPSYSISGFQDGLAQTLDAIENQVDVIYQATVFTGDFVGFIDFLIKSRDEKGDILLDKSGRPIYEPVDTKSARSAKSSAVIQLAAYCEALTRMGLPHPIEGHLWLGNDERWSGDAKKLIPLGRELRERTNELLSGEGQLPSPIWSPPIPSCSICAWEKICESGRKQDRDLSLIQGIRGVTRQKLVAAGIKTIDQLAELSDDDCPVGINNGTFVNLRDQAAIQVLGERTNQIETLIKDSEVLSQLPPTSPGDLWFDMEGDPYAFSGRGLEYMFGVGLLNGEDFDFLTFEGHDVESEKLAFENFIDFVMNRIAKFDHLHIYHYANYERHALTSLATKHATREDEVHQLLREGRLIDLYSVVRTAFRISTPSLSIKDVEHIYRENREKDGVSTAMDSVIQYESYVGLVEKGEIDDANKILLSIRNYNRDDCESTWQLDKWIRSQIDSAGIEHKPRQIGEVEVPENYSQVLADSLLKDIPIDPSKRTATEQALASLSAAVMYHNREVKPFFWNVFELARSSKEELELASDAVAFENCKSEFWGIQGRQTRYRRLVKVECTGVEMQDMFEVDSQVHLLYSKGQPGMNNLADAPGGYSTGKLKEIRSGRFAIIEELDGKEGQQWSALPIGMTAGMEANAKLLQDHLAFIGNEILSRKTQGLPTFPEQAWTDILLRRPPRQLNLDALPKTGNAADDIIEALLDSNSSYIAVQGPPGTGKTFTGSQVVSELIGQGWRVGVVAQSHAVVEQFMNKVRERNALTPMAKKPKGASTLPYHRDKIQEWAQVQFGGFLIGGTAWTFVNPKTQDLNLDLLVIDEAGQFSLANTIAVASTVQRVLLLGDPQQLPQVSQASHPEPVEVAALAHLLNGEPTIPDEFGYFLEKTYRMHSAVTEKVSNLQYKGKLVSAAQTDQRNLEGVEPGIQIIEVDHFGNRTFSIEEAHRILELIEDLIGSNWQKDLNHEPRPLEPKDFIVVAAYNAQVRMLRRLLKDCGLGEIQVGTVDKFQGREAVIAIVSMATSSDEDLPRGIDFLLSPNRLNVAISRAQWAAYVVHSPNLRKVSPSSITGLMNLGGFLGVLHKEVLG